MQKFQSRGLSFFSYLESNNINYCLWKGKKDVFYSLSGKGDLDLFVPSESMERFITAAKKFEIFESVTSRYRSNKHIRDFFYLDQNLSVLVHIQVYSTLVFGAKSESLDYKLSFIPSKLLTERRFKDPISNIYCVELEIEYFILLIRTSLLACKSYNQFVKDVTELQALSAEINNEGFTKFLVKMNIDEDIVKALVVDLKIEHSYLKRIGYLILKKPQRFLCAKKFQAPVRVKNVFSRALQLGKKIELFPFNFHRNQFEGKLIVFVGADGSGKSTQVNRLHKELKRKFNVKYLYMGSGKNETDFFVNIIKIIRSRLKSSANKNKVSSTFKSSSSDKQDKKSMLSIMLLAVYALFLTRSKIKKFARMKKFQGAGYIILIDRFPQTQVTGSNDGPLLNNLLTSHNRLFRLLATVERKYYSKINLIEERALVIKFETSDFEKVYERRKNEMSYENFLYRHKLNHEISYDGDNVLTKVIDSSLPLITVNKLINNHVNTFLGS